MVVAQGEYIISITHRASWSDGISTASTRAQLFGQPPGLSHRRVWTHDPPIHASGKWKDMVSTVRRVGGRIDKTVFHKIEVHLRFIQIRVRGVREASS